MIGFRFNIRFSKLCVSRPHQSLSLSFIKIRPITQFVGLPFTITRTDAYKIIEKNHKWLEENSSKESSSKENSSSKSQLVAFDNKSSFKEYYIPFFSADIKNVRSTFTGYYEEDEIVTYTKTDSEGKTTFHTKIIIHKHKYPKTTMDMTDYPLGNKSTQFYADTSYPKRLIKEAIISSDVNDIRPLDEKDLYDEFKQKRTIMPFVITHSNALDHIMKAITANEKYRGRRQIKNSYYGVDRVYYDSFYVHFSQATISMKPYYMPVFIYTYEKDGAQIHKIVNGYTGEYQGDYAMSVSKATLFWGGITLPFTSYISWMVYESQMFEPSMNIMDISLPFSFSVVCACAGAIYAKRKHISNNNKAMIEKNKREERNKKYARSPEDDIIYQYVKDFNKNTDIVQYSEFQTRQNPLHTYLVILGFSNFDSDKIEDIPIPSKEEIKAKYINTVKLWHPDTYHGDKEIAIDMTQKINDAYNNITKLL